MAGDKRKRRRSFRPLPSRLQRLLTFGIFAAAWEIPEEERTARMVDWLRSIVDGLHGEGYAAPLWLFRRSNTTSA